MAAVYRKNENGEYAEGSIRRLFLQDFVYVNFSLFYCWCLTTRQKCCR